jgi:hypothetical protein
MLGEKGEQLKMFMTPREIGESVSAYGDFGPNMGGLPHEQPKGPGFKLMNSKQSGMYDSIARDGVKHPVAIEHGRRSDGGSEFINGHHRLSVQSSIDPDRLIPVSHWDGKDANFSAPFRGDVDQQKDPTGDRAYKSYD